MMMNALLVVGASIGLATLGVGIAGKGCRIIGRLLAERRDLIAENKFLKMTDDELAAVILADVATVVSEHELAGFLPRLARASVVLLPVGGSHNFQPDALVRQSKHDGVDELTKGNCR